MTVTEEILLEKLFSCNSDIDARQWESTPIRDFYSGSTIFITGCTGFLGRLLLEKLLRSCPGISKLYLLIRNKKGRNMESRLDELLEDVVFDRMKKVRPDFKQKVVGIDGDCALPDLGINQQDKTLIINEVDIIFHVAATVRFSEKLTTAVAINIRATRDLLRMAHQIPKLKSFLHISTTYSNCLLDVIEEKIYPAAMDYKKLLLIIENLPDEVVEHVAPRLRDKYPNTYVFTKQIAENAVRQEGHGLPAGIFRPSTVISTYKEPLRGWINNVYGPTGAVIGVTLGLLKALQFDTKCNANLVPADMCVNSVIAAAWEVGETFDAFKEKSVAYEMPIYNFDTTDQPITWKLMTSLTVKYGILTPSVNTVWYYCFDGYPHRIQYLLATFFLHTLPAFFVDGLLLCMGKSPRMLKAYSKIHKFSDVISFFCTKEWKFSCENVRKLIRRMSVRDREIFWCDLRNLDWEDFCHTYQLGGRLYVLKEPMDTLPEAKKRWRRLYWVHQATKVAVGLLVAWFLWYIFSAVFTIFL